MNYITLKEAYNVDTFERKKKKKIEVQNEDDIQPVIQQKPVEQVVQKSVNEVQPYYDEELEQYLNYKELEKPIERPIEKPIERSIERPVERPIERPIEIPNVVKEDNKWSNDTFYKNMINIGLFIFIGVLIIFLCDQITEIAISLGMKRTVSVLEEYLRK